MFTYKYIILYDGFLVTSKSQASALKYARRHRERERQRETERERRNSDNNGLLGVKMSKRPCTVRIFTNKSRQFEQTDDSTRTRG